MFKHTENKPSNTNAKKSNTGAPHPSYEKRKVERTPDLLPQTGDLSTQIIHLQGLIGNRAVQRLIARSRQTNAKVVQRFTDKDVERRAHEIWVERGRPPNQNDEQRLGDMTKARSELQQIESGASAINSGDAEKDWNQSERQVQGVKGLLRRWGPNEETDNFGNIIRATSQAELIALRTDVDFLNFMEQSCNPGRFGYLTAAMMLIFNHAPNARDEAMRILTAQLQNKELARASLTKNSWAVIVPRNKKMTEITEFASLAGQNTFDGRSWDTVRGVGDVVVGSNHYAAITEENLLGGVPDPLVGGDGYAEGYSTTSHEFAHMLHRNGMSTADRAIITAGYTTKKAATDSYANAKQNKWVDGPRISPVVPPSWVNIGWSQQLYDNHFGSMPLSTRKDNECYASQNEEEYIAQLTNAYLGTNTGNDPTTEQPRNNGRKWIEDNEPANILELLDRLYNRQTVNETTGTGALKPSGKRTNPAP